MNHRIAACLAHTFQTPAKRNTVKCRITSALQNPSSQPHHIILAHSPDPKQTADHLRQDLKPRLHRHPFAKHCAATLKLASQPRGLHTPREEEQNSHSFPALSSCCGRESGQGISGRTGCWEACSMLRTGGTEAYPCPLCLADARLGCADECCFYIACCLITYGGWEEVMTSIMVMVNLHELEATVALTG